jgi:hypothetical protein
MYTFNVENVLNKIGMGSQSSVFDGSSVVIKETSLGEMPEDDVIKILSSISKDDDDLKCLIPLRIIKSDKLEIWFYKSEGGDRTVSDVWRSISKLHCLGLAYWDAHPDNFENYRPVDFGLITLLDKRPKKLRTEVPIEYRTSGVLCDYYFLRKYFLIQVSTVRKLKTINEPWLMNGLILSENFIDSIKYDVFISHKSELKNIFIFDLYVLISRLGYNVFVDAFCLPKRLDDHKLPLDHKYNVKNRIEHSLSKSNIYVCIRSTLRSDWLVQEFSLCVDQLENDPNKKLILVTYGSYDDDGSYIIKDEISNQVILVNLPERNRKQHSDGSKYLNQILLNIPKLCCDEHLG